MQKKNQAKSRALRIPLDSIRHDSLAYYRNWITLAATLVALLWLLIGFLNPRASANRYSPGPVSSAHANLGCGSCHASSAPLADATIFSSWKKTDSSGDQLWHRASDNLCKTCHPVVNAGESFVTVENNRSADSIRQTIPISPHSMNQKVGTVDSCASCHCEHRGADVLPSLVDDASCVHCHQALDDFRLQNPHDIAAKITDFNLDHPAFRSLKTDRGVLKFNHDLHLNAGVMRKGERSELVKTLQDYPDANGKLDNYVDSAGHIQLECDFCHQPVAKPTIGTDLSSNSNLSESSFARFMSMPSYKKNCQVCHPIEAIPSSGVKFDSKLVIEHGASPEKILNDLKVYFSLAAIAPPEIKKPLTDVNVSTPAMAPTRLWDIKNPQENSSEIGIPQGLVDQAANHLRSTCFHCHLPSSKDSSNGIPVIRTIDDKHASTDPAGDAAVVDSAWFRLGKFDHSAHRDMKCDQCHTMNGGKNEILDLGQELSADRPMIKDLESCRECHQEASKVKFPDRAGPTSCTSCHSYHGAGNQHSVSP